MAALKIGGRMSNINIIREQIEKANKIAIVSHINPDADALCSSCALKNIIRNNFDYKFIDVFVDGEIGELYSPILRNEVINPIPYSSYDLAIVLDCPTLFRTGKYQDLIKNTPYTMNMDHHETNEGFANINVVSTKVSSTSELVYLLAKGQNYEINNIIAKELYQGIITDTNCFTSLTLTERTHQVVSELLKYKFDADAIKEYYFKNNSKAKMQLLSQALGSMKFYKGDMLTTMKISYDTFEKLGASFDDTMGIIDNGINISGTAISAILIEDKPGHLYCSLRSKGQIHVGSIAIKFNGGGSETSAAFQAEGDIKDFESRLVAEILPLLSNVEIKEDPLF